MTGPDWHFRKVTGAEMWRLGFRGEPLAGPEMGGCRWVTVRLEGGQR